ncbi:Phosphotransferase enzyme family protein [Roseovarius nanhaiticus]|uniref:Phosphotransferase enzyme family protein n=1 Tax=Roseovarius nanhaiticus TaxID=573024 RepID=A0A1N7GG16_9RHOB|nr:phosphotransferase [Roseovarius nanhaiticus]SEK27302.1 Phosphotransferase enzyme family protein [Roseovarius nanhaiticus]SIS11449.1 Phosphotransferase enzyme family protein [Roseovarius nanhaiticus]
MSAPLPPIPDLDATQRIAALLAKAARQEPRLSGANPTDLLRLVKDKRAILRGQLEGRDVIFRVHLAPEAGDAQREWDEMQRLWPLMSVGDLRVPEPICAAPDAGVTVQEAVPGTPLMELLYSLDAKARPAFMAPAAAWLRASTQSSEDWQIAQPQRWINRASRAAQQQPFAALREVEAGILAHMERIAPIIADAPWRAAICHGDFHPNNLICYGTRLTGIDLGGSRRMPVLKDIARFAMHMGRRRLRLSGKTVLGVDHDCLQSFAHAFGLSPLERSHTLPFFLAFEALIRVETPALPSARVVRAEKTYRALLADLQRLEDGGRLI